MNGLDILLVALPALLLYGLGYLIRFRKAYWLISGFNTMSAEKKKNVDTENLGVLMGNLCFVMGTLLSAGILLIFLDQPTTGFIILGLELPVIGYAVIAAQKYDGNTRTEAGTMKIGSKIAIALVILSLALVLVFVGNLIYQGMQPQVILVEQGNLKIAGSYGQTIPLADIVEVQLLDNLPKIQLRTNGSAIGSQLRGHFRMADQNQVMLYLDRSQSPFIYLETASQKIYLNSTSPELTRQLFETIQAR